MNRMDGEIIFHIDVNSAYLSWSAYGNYKMEANWICARFRPLWAEIRKHAMESSLRNPFRQKPLEFRRRKPLPVHFKNVRHL